MTAPQLTLDAQHRYWLSCPLGPRQLPGVTSMIRTFFPMAWEPAEFYKGRGTAIHSAIHLEAQGKLDYGRWAQDVRDSQPQDSADVILNKFGAYRRFVIETKFKPVHSEMAMHSARLNFAGTIDAVGVFGDDPTWVLVDYKSSCDLLALILQLGLYSLLYSEDTGARPTKVAGLILKDDGNYKLVWGTRNPVRDNAKFNLSDAENAGRNLVSLYSLKQKYQPTTAKE